jgi:hypothetical protein
MYGLKKKLQSEKGASILLVLLFFLVCILVSASVLMAATSNAGKVKSNREAQQEYLLVSSALQLVCDDITASTYTPQYKVEVTTTATPNATGGTSQSIASVKYSRETGKVYKKGTSTEYSAGIVYNLLCSDLDKLFGKEMNSQTDDIKTWYANTTVEPGETDTSFSSHEFTVKVPDTATTEYSELGKSVQITVKVRDGYVMDVIATLYEEESTTDVLYQMQAELTPEAKEVPRVTKPILNANDVDTVSTHQTEQSVTWKVSQINNQGFD